MDDPLDDSADPSVEGVISRPGLGLAYELKILPKRLPNWMGGPSGGLFEAALEAVVLAAVGDRSGVKLIVFRGPASWFRSVISVREIVVFEIWPDSETCERRALEVRRSVEAGEYDKADSLSRTERRTLLRAEAKD